MTKSNDAEAEEIGSGKKQLTAILIACGIFFSASITGVAPFFITLEAVPPTKYLFH